MNWYFYSIPTSAVPSPYFKRLPKLLADLSRKGIFRFRIWQGTYDAPYPVEAIDSEQTSAWEAL